MRYTKYFLLLLFLSLFIIGCSTSEKEKKYVIGVSQCMLDDAWRQAMVKEMQIEASNYDNIEIIVKDANSKNDTQIRQIKELINDKVDVLIISPFQSNPITEVAEEAYKAGIPTIITDRKVNTDLYTTFVGADNYTIGYAAGRYAARYLPPSASILEIWGLSSSSPAQERHQGFIDALLKRSDLSFRKVEGEWVYDTAKVRLKQLEWPFKVDFVYSHNDMMAIAAREYFMEKAPEWASQLPIIGVDAVAGAGLEAVSDGRINASFLYPTGGEQVIRTAMQILNGEPVEKYIPLQTGEIDKVSAQTLLIQSARLLNYQRRIEQQRSNLDTLLNRFNFLQNSFLIISVLMIGFILLSIYTFVINFKLKKTNHELREINRKEEEQREKLIQLNAEIKEVTAQKLQFFTNISHEVRTPLTLILGPLDKLLKLLHDSPYLRDLQLMQKNAEHLLRVINQILDFRKVENKQEKLKIRNTDLVAFIRELKSYFDSMAAVRHIDFTFTSDLKECNLWFDPVMMEKVLINLLSNAFKFTPENGTIRISLAEVENKIQVSVEDSGRGIKPENIPYLFTRFYTENTSSGTGIGLHLVKEYVDMHHGTIAVESCPGTKTVFTLTLLKGKEHFTDGYVTELPISPLAYDASQLDDSVEKELLSVKYPYTILITEDDEEVRAYLKEELQDNFDILLAANGKEALEVLATEDVSLVLSDVMMPEMNGFELCRYVKTNLSTSHIPVVLLTALSDERQRNFGLSGGADEYIQKPFRINFVKLKMIRILEERKRLRDQLLEKLQKGKLLLTEPDKVKNMDDIFLNNFIKCIEEVYADTEYNVEKLSDTLGLSRGHLHRKIKELTGTTPVEFLRNYRLSKAAAMLKQKQYTVSEIAYQTGFSSPAYFSKCFKQVYDVTPTEYQ